jgi:hypothetical protein
MSKNVALTDLSASIVREQVVPWPWQGPNPQRVNSQPLFGVAVRVTGVPSA